MPKRLRLALTVFGLAALFALPTVPVPVQAQKASLAMLSGIKKGEWIVRFRDDDRSTRVCVRTGFELIQLRHVNSVCSRFVVEDGANEITVQYTCPAKGYARTNLRRETSTLVQIESQGIAAGGLPFQFLAEARHIGPCR